MQKPELIELFNGLTEVARFFGISKSAVSQWSVSIPKLREYQARELRPTIDEELAALKKKRAAKRKLH